MTSDPKNLYKPNLNTDNVKTAKTHFLRVVSVNLRVRNYFLIKNSPKFLFSNPKNPFKPFLNTQSAK